MKVYASYVFDNPADSTHGAECTFYKVGQCGIKCYNSEEQRNRVYACQLLMWRMGFAPEPYHKINATNGEAVIFAYTTELAVTSAEVFAEQRGQTVDEMYAANAYTVEDKFLDEHFSELLDSMREQNICMGDTHIGNFGWVDGRAVVIDCGEW